MEGSPEALLIVDQTLIRLAKKVNYKLNGNEFKAIRTMVVSYNL